MFSNALILPFEDVNIQLQVIHSAAKEHYWHEVISRRNMCSVEIINHHPSNVSTKKKLRPKQSVPTTPWGCPLDEGPPHDRTTITRYTS